MLEDMYLPLVVVWIFFFQKDTHDQQQADKITRRVARPLCAVIMKARHFRDVKTSIL